jgi:hypothetical protein
MGLSSRFTVRHEATPALLDLLTKTTLGTNGACYRHLDTRTRILEADNPVFVSLERDGKVQGNVTFCQRKERWYVRYFAFSGQKQASKNVNRVAKSNSRLKQEIADFYMHFGEYACVQLLGRPDVCEDPTLWKIRQFWNAMFAISSKLRNTKPFGNMLF